MAPRGILSVLESDHDIIGHTSHPTTNDPWFHVSFGVKIKALPVVQEAVDRRLDLPTTRNTRGALCVPCGPPFCFSNTHIYHNQAFVLPSSSSLPQVCETLPHQPELPQPFRLKCPTLSGSPFPMSRLSFLSSAHPNLTQASRVQNFVITLIDEQMTWAEKEPTSKSQGYMSSCTK